MIKAVTVDPSWQPFLESNQSKLLLEFLKGKAKTYFLVHQGLGGLAPSCTHLRTPVNVTGAWIWKIFEILTQKRTACLISTLYAEFHTNKECLTQAFDSHDLFFGLNQGFPCAHKFQQTLVINSIKTIVQYSKSTVSSRPEYFNLFWFTAPFRS